jgi:hypothetical protein
VTMPADARRADWRFLLPEPELGAVAYLPPHDPELAAALRLVSARVDLDGGGADHAVVVLTGAQRGAIPAARALLERGGWLYAEVPGRAVRAWRRALRGAGFDEVAGHWLWPDPRGCREIVPLERRALRHALGRRDPGAVLRVRVRLARVLVAVGAFPLAVRRAAVVGRRQ